MFSIIFLLMFPRFIGGTAQNSGQRLDNVHPTHLELAGGKLVLQKMLERVKVNLQVAKFLQ